MCAPIQQYLIQSLLEILIVEVHCLITLCFPHYLLHSLFFSHHICQTRFTLMKPQWLVFVSSYFYRCFVISLLLNVSQICLPLSLRWTVYNFSSPTTLNGSLARQQPRSGRSARESHTYCKHVASYSTITFSGVCFSLEAKGIRWKKKKKNSQLLKKTRATLLASRKGRKDILSIQFIEVTRIRKKILYGVACTFIVISLFLLLNHSDKFKFSSTLTQKYRFTCLVFVNGATTSTQTLMEMCKIQG